MQVENFLQPLVQLFTLAEQVVQPNFAEHGSQRRLRELRCRIQIIFYFHDGASWVHYPKINYGIYFDADVIRGDDVLGRNVENNGPQADPNNAIDRPEYPDEPRAFGFAQKPTDAED